MVTFSTLVIFRDIWQCSSSLFLIYRTEGKRVSLRQIYVLLSSRFRRMFPAMRVKIAGLDPHQQYYIAMDIVPVDNKRYRYLPHTQMHQWEGDACADRSSSLNTENGVKPDIQFNCLCTFYLRSLPNAEIYPRVSLPTCCWTKMISFFWVTVGSLMSHDGLDAVSDAFQPWQEWNCGENAE